MKKLTALLLAFVLVLSFAACGTEDADTPKEFGRGVITGDVYKSEYSGIRFTKPAEWKYYTDDELAATMNVSADALNNSFLETVASLTTIYDMMVIDQNTGTNISVAYENLKLTANSDMTCEAYLEAMKTQLAAIDTMTMEFGEPSTVTLCGEEYMRVISTTSMGEITVSQIYYLRNVDGYMNFMVATLSGDYDAAAIEAMFG